VQDAPAGFRYSSKITTTTADASVTGADRASFAHLFENANWQRFSWGTSNAKTITVSFWVKSSLTGTFFFAISLNAGGAAYYTTYTIIAANTWEYKTITIPGPTAASNWATDTVNVLFGLTAGPDRQTSTLNAWTTDTTNALGTSTTVNLVSTLNATWQITGWQIEAGSTATNFSLATGTFATELAACQRYYQTSFDLGQTPAHNASYFGETTLSCVNGGFNTNSYGAILFPTKMRTAPTVNIWNTRNASVSGNSARFYNSGTAYETSSIDMGITTSSSHGMTFKGTNIGASAIVFFGYSASAEL
jgi:hypothetical protein